MRYDEFRGSLLEALTRSRLLSHHFGPTETANLARMDRRFRIAVGHLLGASAGPFHVSGQVSFSWDAMQEARSDTCEEGVLTELYAEKVPRRMTEPRLLRVDFELRASLPHDSVIWMPEPGLWDPWVATLHQRLEALLPSHVVGDTIPSWHGELEIGARATASGLSLTGLGLPSFQFVRLPRVWDDPRRRAREKSSQKDIDQLVGRYGPALEVWTQTVAELAHWIRIGPNPSVLLRLDPFADDGDDGPPTLH